MSSSTREIFGGAEVTFRNDYDVIDAQSTMICPFAMISLPTVVEAHFTKCWAQPHVKRTVGFFFIKRFTL